MELRRSCFLSQVALCNEPLQELSNAGASGSLFYVTNDDEFIIKTVQHKEADFLQKLLPGYYLVRNKNIVLNFICFGGNFFLCLCCCCCCCCLFCLCLLFNFLVFVLVFKFVLLIQLFLLLLLFLFTEERSNENTSVKTIATYISGLKTHPLLVLAPQKVKNQKLHKEKP